VRTSQLAESRRRKTNRTGAHHQYPVGRSYLSPAHGVRADGQELDHGRFVEAQLVCVDNKACGYADIFSQRAVPMHSQHLEASATVGLTLSAGDTDPTGQVGHHCDPIARHELRLRGRFHHFPGKLVADESRIGQVRLLAAEDVVVGAAHPDPTNADQHFIGAAHRNGPVLGEQLSRL